MPKRHGVEVNVTDTRNNAFVEYGIQSDGRFTGEKSRVSTFIEAKNGTQFFIRVTVDNPFKFEEDLDPIERLAASVVQKPYPARQVQSQHNTRTKHFDDNRPAEEELKGGLSKRPTTSKVPFDLMVSVYIDGRAKPECRQMIYLDHTHPDYNPCCVLKGRWVDPGDASQDGRAGLLQWVFSDRGIDHILGQLDVKKVLGKADTDVGEAQFQALCEDVGDGILEEPEEKTMKAGQIEVRLRRVITQGSNDVEQKFKAYHYAGSDEKPRQIDDGCTHTTSFMPRTAPAGEGKIETFALRHVAWNFYKKGENFWAKFIFNYTARHKLVNMRLSEPDGKPVLRGRPNAAEADSASKRGKKRASSIDGDSVEQRWAENPVPRKISRSISTNDLDDETSTSEEEEYQACINDALRTQRRYDMRRTSARVDNSKKTKIEDDSDQIS